MDYTHRLMNRCYTIGHSDRPFEEFIDILHQYEIRYLIDIRSYPLSIHEQYNKENLELTLPKHHLLYYHCPGLGGMREQKYMEYASTPEFKKYFDKLLKKITEASRSENNIVLMCAEKSPKHCHRSELAKVLENEDVKVIHLTEPGQADLFSF